MAGFAIMSRVKGYSLKLLDMLYGASVASVLVLCTLIFFAAMAAMAISVKLIDLPPVHPPQ